MAYTDDYGHDFCDGELEDTITMKKPKYIVQELMGSDFPRYFYTDVTDERHEKHVWDAKHGL